jgi:hypothetical protein
MGVDYNIEAKTFSIRLVRQLGHDRWRLENNGWCDLTKHWALKHGFLHACKHRPQRRDAEGQLQPLPNHGLQAVTLILCIAFILCSAFARLHSKLFRRYRLSMLEVSRQRVADSCSFQVFANEVRGRNAKPPKKLSFAVEASTAHSSPRRMIVLHLAPLLQPPLGLEGPPANLLGSPAIELLLQMYGP